MVFFSKKKSSDLHARLFVLLFFRDDSAYRHACRLLEKRLGKLDYESALLDAPKKEEYPEAKGLPKLKVVSFKRPIHRAALPELCLFCKKTELRFTEEGEGSLSLYAGYASLLSVVGSSLADDYFRIYLDQGVYAEPLFFQRRSILQPWPHTPSFWLERSVLTAIKDIHLIYANESLQE